MMSQITTNFAPRSMVKPAEKMLDVKPSIWVSINHSVSKYKPINLGQGFPDFAPPAQVLKNLNDVTADENFLLHQYTRSMGHQRLVNVLAELYRPFLACRDSSAASVPGSFLPEHKLDPLTNILISNGAYGSLFAAFSAVINPGDECIVMEPCFDCYAPMTRQAGGVPVFVQLMPKTEQSASSADWTLDMEQLERVVTPKTRALVLNTPHNPLGKVFSRQELEQIASFCIKHNLICISDEVYEWVVFPDNPEPHIKIASLPGMWSRTITIGSAGKTFSVTGWKLGWSIGPQELILAMQAHQQNTVYTCPTPLQEAVARSLEQQLRQLKAADGHCYLVSLKHQLQTKSQRMAEGLQQAHMRPVMPQSGYFMIADASTLPVSEEFKKQHKLIDLQANEWLIQTKGICGIPLSVFYFSEEAKQRMQNYIRWCFAKQEETLADAFSVLSNLH